MITINTDQKIELDLLLVFLFWDTLLNHFLFDFKNLKRKCLTF